MLIEPVPTYPYLLEQQTSRGCKKMDIKNKYGYQTGRNNYSENRIVETSRYPTINCSYYVALTMSSYISEIYFILGSLYNYHVNSLVFWKTTTCNYVFY